MFGNNSSSGNKERDKFIKNFEEASQDKICSMELAELKASNETLSLLGFQLKKSEYSIWGLLISGEKGNYFYKTAQTGGFFGGLIPRKEDDLDAKEMMVNLSDLNGISYSLLKKGFADFLFPEKKRMLDAEFCDTEGNKHVMTFVFTKKAAAVLSNLVK